MDTQEWQALPWFFLEGNEKEQNMAIIPKIKMIAQCGTTSAFVQHPKMEQSVS
jgi:hypothetical protein